MVKNLINAVLWFFLVVQLALGLPAALSKNGLPVPRFLEKQILRWALGPHWKLEHSLPIRLSLGGWVSMQDVQLVHRQDASVSLGAGLVSVNLSWMHLLAGRNPVEGVHIQAGRVHGPQNPSEALIDTLYLQARIEEHAFFIDFASAHLPKHHHRALLGGRIPQCLLKSTSAVDSKVQAKSINDCILEGIQALEAFQGRVPKDLKELYVRGSPGPTLGAIEFYAAAPPSTFGPVTFHGPIEAHAVCTLGRTLCWKSPLIAQTDKTIEVLNHQAASGRIIVPLKTLLLPSLKPSKTHAYFALKDLQLLQTSWAWGTGSIHFDPIQARGRVYLLHANTEFLSGQFHWADKKLELHIEGNSDPLHWAQEFFPVDRYLRLQGPRYWAIHTVLGEDWKPRCTQFRVAAQSPWAYQVPMRHVYMEGVLEGQQLHVPYFEAMGMKSHVQGSYEHHLGNHAFRFLIQGEVEPLEIQPWMGAYWPRIFNPFKICGPRLPRGSLDISGHWDDAEATARLWGKVEGEDLEYRGICAQYARATLCVSPDCVSLEEGFIKRPEGISTGRVQWDLLPPFDTLISSTFEAQGRMFISDLHTWSKNEFLSFLKKLSFSGAPTYTVKGLYEAQKDDAYTISAQLDVQSPFYYKKLHLDSATGVLDFKDNQLQVYASHLGFAGGSGTVSVQVDTRQDSKTPYHLELDIKDITQRDVLESSFSDFAIPANEYPAEKPGSFGSLDVQAVLDGDLRQDPILSADGTGSFQLTDMDMDDVYFLGLLSHIMRILPLPFGRVSLDCAQGHFSLAPEGQLYFDELLIKGPAAEVRGQGAYDLALDSLDIQLKFFLLGGVRAPVFSHLGRLLNPLSNIFEVYVSGPLADPKWGFRR